MKSNSDHSDLELQSQYTIGIIGLGYVGLPLAAAFAGQFNTIGFDINQQRINELQKGHDRTLEVSQEELTQATHLRLTADPKILAEANFFIVTVPTPIDDSKRPDLGPLKSASEMLGKIIDKGDIIVYESTVYPGATEEVCMPILERHSGLKYRDDFFLGYSPERINPGDKTHRVTDIVKVTSGCCETSATIIDNVYKAIIVAGTHKASSIKVAEAAKVIENTQRDLNIALINELSMIFSRLGIDTQDVLAAAGTKWNFLPFKPGLVGGHCIGVDPYYLTHKAQSIGYHPEVILAGRRINDNMAIHTAEQVVKLLTKKRLPVCGGKILVLGLAFKENCPDIRNTKVVDLITELGFYHTNVDVFDPHVDAQEAHAEYGYSILQDWDRLVKDSQQEPYHGLIFAVAHDSFLTNEKDYRALVVPDGVIFDIKGKLPRDIIDARL